jgi:RimJ/RimL family protein N-acetyltransferase
LSRAHLPELHSRRLVLRAWRDDDRDAFAAMNADPRVMAHFPSTLERGESDALADRIGAHFDDHGFGLWALEVPDVVPFAGFVGLALPSFDAPFGPCVEIGWRLAPASCGQGYAREAAATCVTFAFETLHLAELVSFTVPENLRSIGVMRALGMTNDPRDDFDHPRLPAGHRLRRHLLYRLTREEWIRRSQRSPVGPTPAERARAFAAALDEDDFERARPLLSPHCVYEVRGSVIHGSNAILRSYAAATRKAHGLFHQVGYESQVEATSTHACIEFVDVLRHGGHEHRHRSRQHLGFGADQRIATIVHEDLEGEAEALRDFLARCGLSP